MTGQPLQQVYLQPEEAEEIFEYLKEEYPLDGISMLNETGFYSALHKPLNKALYQGEMDIAEHAANQMMAFAVAHSLTNANKRMGILAAYMVLRNNGYSFKRMKRFYKLFAPLLEKIIKYKKYDLPFLCLSIKLAMDEEFTPPVDAYEKRLKGNSKRKRAENKRKKPWNQRKR